MLEAATSSRFLFDSLPSAAEGLMTVLLDARKTKKQYSFSGLNIQQVSSSGLVLTGQIEDIALKLEQVPGAIRSSS